MRAIAPESESPVDSSIMSAFARHLRPALLAWLAIPLFLAGIVIVGLTGSPDSFEQPYLLAALHMLFTLMAAGLVLVLLTRCFAARGTIDLLFVSCGLAAWAQAGIVAVMVGLNAAGGRSFVNLAITIHNTSVCLAGACHLLGAVLSLRAQPIVLRRTALWLVVGLSGTTLAVAAVAIAAAAGLTPLFFVNGVGGTPIRQGVLFASAVMFAAASAMIARTGRRTGSGFASWYAPALGLIAVGLLGVALEITHGGIQSWLGRSAQFLSGGYFVVAALVAVRESSVWGIPLELAARHATQRFEQLFELAGDGILVHEITDSGVLGIFLRANPAICRLLGYSAQELARLAPPDIMAPEDRLQVGPDVTTIRHNGLLMHRKTLIARDGRRIQTEISTRMFSEAGQTMAISIIRDVTDRQRAEAALLEANEQLEAKVAERTAALSHVIDQLRDEVAQRLDAEQALTSANAELLSRAAQLRQLASELTLTEQRERRRMATVLHDHLQQLLVGAKFRMALLSRTEDKIVRDGCKEIEELIDESIKTSRSLTAELSPPILHEGGLGPGLEWLAQWMADRHGLTVDLSMDSDIPPLAEDVKILLFESVRELLFNAIKHARVHAASVALRLIEKPAEAPGALPVGLVQIVVRDQGRGFDPALVKPAGSGGGFGLFSIRERLSLIGGQMQIESAPDVGSKFVLTAPVGLLEPQAQPVEEEQPSARAADVGPVQISSPLLGARIRVLLADDHEVMRQGLAELLGQEDDIQIVGQAGDGDEAVELAGRLLPDVILMDMSMPRLNGIEATQSIHRDHPDIRIIGLSMFEETERAEAMRRAGAAAFLTKSGHASDLIAAIHDCMSLPVMTETAARRPRRGRKKAASAPAS